MNDGGWIGVDLDGTLAKYDGWKGEDHIGEPIEPMVTLVRQWISDGLDVRIFTARVDGGEVAIAMGNENGERFRDVKRIVCIIEAWCLQHVGVVLPVTNKKDYGMIQLWDDRAVQVVPNEGRPIYKERENLASLVRRLARKLPSGDKTKVQALDYLKRIGMSGSILRNRSTPAEESTNS